MTPQQTLDQITQLTQTLVGLSLSNAQNFPSVVGKFNKSCEITVSTSAAMSAALRNVAYSDIYKVLDNARCYNIKMLDGALISFHYRFLRGSVSEHSLKYFPSPDLEHFQNEPEVYLEDEIYADVVAKNIVPFPVRFDFSDDIQKFVEVHHPYSHLTLGQYKNCRIPVCSPVSPFTFIGFILRNFYNTAFLKYSEKLPVSNLTFGQTITAGERLVSHFVCGV